jgi:DNA modification methylase
MTTQRIIPGDCLAGLRTLPDASVHCCVTSPPYWGLRQYLFEGAVVVRSDLPEHEKQKIISELERLGVKPRC